MPLSVPANSSPVLLRIVADDAREASARLVRWRGRRRCASTSCRSRACGRHTACSRPRDADRSAAYAVAASKCDGSTANIRRAAAFGMPGSTRRSHVLPPSRVTLIRPLFVPTQMHARPRPSIAAIDSIAPPGGAVGARRGRRRRSRRRRTPRSGLIAVQCAPPSIGRPHRLEAGDAASC